MTSQPLDHLCWDASNEAPRRDVASDDSTGGNDRVWPDGHQPGRSRLSRADKRVG